MIAYYKMVHNDNYKEITLQIHIHARNGFGEMAQSVVKKDMLSALLRKYNHCLCYKNDRNPYRESFPVVELTGFDVLYSVPLILNKTNYVGKKWGSLSGLAYPFYKTDSIVKQLEKDVHYFFKYYMRNYDPSGLAVWLHHITVFAD